MSLHLPKALLQSGADLQLPSIGSLPNSSNLVGGPPRYHHARPPDVLTCSHSRTEQDYPNELISSRFMGFFT
jgi:hypothetical protein